MKIARSSRFQPKGFNLIELLFVIVIIATIVIAVVWGVVISAGIMGNQWYTEEGVLKAIQLKQPAAVKVLTSTRGVYSNSEILVELEGGARETYSLDSNMLFNYDVKKKAAQ